MLHESWLDTDFNDSIFDEAAGIAEAPIASSARLAFVGRAGVGKSTLYNELRGWRISDAATPLPEQLPRVEDFGTTLLIDLPEMATDGNGVGPVAREVFDLVSGADLVLYVLDAGQPADARDAQWVGGLRALGTRVLAVANGIDRSEIEADHAIREAASRLACPVVAVSARTGDGLDRLVESAMSLGPDAAVALGHEVPRARRSAARRRIRQAASRSLVGGRVAGSALGLIGQMSQHEHLHRDLSVMFGRAETDAKVKRSGIAVLFASAALFKAATRLARRLPFHLAIAASVLDAGVTLAYGSLLLWHLERQHAEEGGEVPQPRRRPVAHRARRISTKLGPRRRWSAWRERRRTRRAGLAPAEEVLS